MVIRRFPPVEEAGPEGLLAIGGDLHVESLLNAYRQGVFPWPTEEYPLLWFAPPKRAILDFKQLKIPRRYQRERKKLNLNFKIDHDFPRVIHACAEGLTRNSQGTWITPAMLNAFIEFHQAGYAHSFEAYNSKGQLVGGLYGVSLGQMFAGESMFFWESGASKETLIFTCEYLAERGAGWMDVQMLSPLLRDFGAKEIPRKSFMAKLTQALQSPEIFPPKALR